MKRVSQFLVIIYFIACSGAQASDSTPKAVDEYVKLLEQARAKKTTLEAVYKKGFEAVRSLSDSLSYNESEVDQKWLQSLRKKMDGFELNPNTETYVANPKPEFFVELAKKYGSEYDVAFFGLMQKTKPDGRMNSYIEQQTDYGGCTIYDGTLSKLYKEWITFQKKYPKVYIQMTKDRIEDIEDHIANSQCSCVDTSGPILKELEAFVVENPREEFTKKVQKRIKSIKHKSAPIPGCKGMG